jgi:hypothetical protein
VKPSVDDGLLMFGFIGYGVGVGTKVFCFVFVVVVVVGAGADVIDMDADVVGGIVVAVVLVMAVEFGKDGGVGIVAGADAFVDVVIFVVTDVLDVFTEDAVTLIGVEFDDIVVDELATGEVIF